MANGSDQGFSVDHAAMEQAYGALPARSAFLGDVRQRVIGARAFADSFGQVSGSSGAASGHGNTISEMELGLAERIKWLDSITEGIRNANGEVLAFDENGAAKAAATGSGTPAVPELTASDEPATSLTRDQLMEIMPRLSQEKAEEYLAPLNQAMADADVNTTQRKAAFLSQLSVESKDLTDFEEDASGRAYEGNVKNLGNTQPGDGPLFKGRGPIQLTGRDNYTRAGAALGVDLVGNPNLVRDDTDTAFRTASWFWNDKHPNAAADAGNFDRVSRLVNGGTNGLAERRAAYTRTLGILNCYAPLQP